ncbi:aminoglycoside phosphotransferase family protein (plasmid) [Deinococcus psychrotolerans]|uniref:Aminoglycoside phosphotransferase family protein n=1 Tax=Deinococcus psychrotolerans TaxID=2489213 RepID=A0A3G8YGY8_9DEIO|nr:aminoglycoside phosphotransferase family protein [Deinococcus psychrotolerans]AZI44589.1 aminoglycoside phosphotransferase family protein [Deinococcus psychrotolerans]
MSSFLTPQTLSWLGRVVPDAKLSRVQPLAGSTSASVYRLDFSNRSSAVLRQFDVLPDWLKLEPDLALHEARSLEWAAQMSLPTPKLLAFDESGEQCGVPSVLMSHLTGTVELNPPNLTGELDQLAAALSEIHRVSPTDFGWAYAPYADLSKLTVPTWTTAPRAWAGAIELLQGPRPTFTPCFIHRDFHPANVLRQSGQVSGVVDWVNACVGPAAADVGHCRLNLAQMYGLEAADAFRAAYECHTGHRQEPYWDALSLADLVDGPAPPKVYAGWPAFGLTGLTDELIRARLDAFLLSLGF